MRLLIVRHADPEYHGDTLTAEGVREAQALARRLCTGSDGSVARLFTSPLGRARDTARWSELALGLVAAVEPWTRELSHWPRQPGAGPPRPGEGRPGEGGMALWDIRGETVRGLGGLSAENMWQRVEGFGNEEVRKLFEELGRSSDEFIARLGYVREGGRYRIERKNREVNVVFCHGGFGLTWLAHLLQIPLVMVYAGFYLPPSSVTTVLFEERSRNYATPRVIGMGDVSHLYAEGLRIPDSKYEKPNAYGSWKRPSGIKANFW